VSQNANDLTYTATRDPAIPPSTGRPIWRLLIAFGLPIIVVLAAVLAWRGSTSSAEAQAKPAARDVPYLDGKWIRYPEEFAKRASSSLRWRRAASRPR
jgi:hypothetical protein